MKVFKKENVQKRLKELREKKNWSQNDMAQKLNELIGYDSASNVMNLDGETGKQTVSQLERGARGITIEIAFAYSEIFGTSLEYILGSSDDWQPENKTVKELTGLNDEAIKNLQNDFTTFANYNELKNKFIGHKDFQELITKFAVYIRHEKYFAGNPDLGVKAVIGMFGNPEISDLILTTDEIIEADYYKCQKLAQKIIDSVLEIKKEGY